MHSGASLPKIALDKRATEMGFKAHYGRGTGRYVSELLGALKKISNDSQELQAQLTTVGSEELGIKGLEKAFYSLVPLGRSTLEQQFLLPRRIRRLGADMFHFFSHVDAPARCPIPYLVTVLDLIPLRFPDLYSADKANWRFRFARFLELQAIQNASGLLAISEATKRDLVELLGIEPSLIYVTPLAASRSFTPRSLEGETWQKRLVEKKLQCGLFPSVEQVRPVLLYVGGIDARKNVLFLIDLLAELHQQLEAASRPRLVMVGKYEADNYYPKLLSHIEKKDLKNEVELLGFVSDEELSELYQAADIKLFPSLYEGFGLPVLEAMSCGLPVVAGDNSSIPEVAGEAAVLVQDNDLTGWVKNVMDVLSSHSRQQTLGSRGIEQSARFSWERTARETIQAYEYFMGLSKDTVIGAAKHQEQRVEL